MKYRHTHGELNSYSGDLHVDLYGEALCDVNMEKTFLVGLLRGSCGRYLHTARIRQVTP